MATKSYKMMHKCGNAYFGRFDVIAVMVNLPVTDSLGKTIHTATVFHGGGSNLGKSTTVNFNSRKQATDGVRRFVNTLNAANNETSKAYQTAVKKDIQKNP